MAIHPNTGILAVGDRWIGTISLYDTNSGKLLATLNQSSSIIDYDVTVNSIGAIANRHWLNSMPVENITYS